MKHKFQPNNDYGTKSSRKGVPNAINKTEAIKLVNMLLEDLTTNYETLTTWQKLKLFGYTKDILKEAIVDQKETGGFTIPQVITLQPVYANQLKQN